MTQSRRSFLKDTAGLAALTTIDPHAALGRHSFSDGGPRNTCGIQIGPDCFYDEGIDKVLDILQDKGAVDTLVKHFASALGERGIRVNAVAPGVVATDMSSFTKTDEGRGVAIGMQALKRLAQPDDIGSAVAFLASDAARWITGETLHVDGGSKL